MSLLPREYGFNIGLALESRQFKRAKSILEEAIVNFADIKTKRIYTEPLAEICTDPRALNCFDDAGAVTVEDFYRTDPAEFYKKASENFSSRQEIDWQSGIVEQKYSKRLHGQLYPEVVTQLINGNFLNVYDVCWSDRDELRAALRDPNAVRQVAALQRKYRA